MKRKLLLSLLLIFTFSLYGQNTVRIAAYNVERYSNVAARNNYFNNVDTVTKALKVVLNQIKPTILLATELDGTNVVQNFLSNILSPKYKASGEVNITWGYGNECAVFYLDSLFTYLGSSMISADTRPIAEFKFVHKFTNDTLIIFGVHLKAYTYETARRLSAVNSLRNRTLQLKPTDNYMVVGDFNIFTSDEPAFQKLLDQSSPGYFYDPQNAVGNWTDNSVFAHTHTYSPSYLKSRLDMILISQALKDKGGVDYIEDSFKIFGNDGKHFATSITNGSNPWFSNISIGNALILASDHLPVYADFTFGVSTSVSKTETLPTTFELKQNYPNPFNPTTVISYQLSVNSYVTLKIYDLLGREIAIIVDEFQNAGIYHSTFSTLHSSLVSGVYIYTIIVKSIAGDKEFRKSLKFVLMK